MYKVYLATPKYDPSKPCLVMLGTQLNGADSFAKLKMKVFEFITSQILCFKRVAGSE